MSTEKTFGERLKELRMSRGLTRKQLCGILQMSYGTMSSYEADARNPSAAGLQLFARFYGLTVDELKDPNGIIPPVHTETPVSDRMPDTEKEPAQQEAGQVQGYELLNLLRSAGLVDDEKDLSDSDLRFLLITLDGIRKWFQHRG